MAVRKKTTGMLLYNLLIKEVSAANKFLPSDKKLTIRERRAFVSEKIYPQFKGTPKSQIRLGKIRSFIKWHISRVPSKVGCDVLGVPTERLSNIDYFVIDSYIVQLPDCIHIKVNGNGFGATNIFNTGDYEYYSSGVSAITNRINEWIRNLPSKHGVYPSYDGVIQVRHRRKNDGHPDSYYIEFILKGGKQKIEYEKIVVPEITEPERKKQVKRQRRELGRRIAREKVLKLQKEKAAFKQLKRNFNSSITVFHNFIATVKRKKLKINIAKVNKEEFKAQKKKADKYLKNGKFTKAEYKIILKLITTGYDQ